jgi:hypothetical protein
MDRRGYAINCAGIAIMGAIARAKLTQMSLLGAMVPLFW